MKTSQPKPRGSSKPQSRRFWMGCITILLVSPFLLYYGYCWGLWGRQSLLLQYLFQCNCPPASEEARYPDEVDVVVSACQHISSRLSPSGRLLYVEEKSSGIPSTYFMDLQTGEKTPISLVDSAFYFLTDDLLYIFKYYEGSEYIWDRTTNMKYPLQRFIVLQPNAYSYGEVDPDLLFSALLQADTFFLIDAPSKPVIVLSSDFRTNPKHSFILDQSDLPGEASNQVEQFFQQNNILYSHIADTFPDEAISQNGKFVARADGIYLMETGQRLVNGYSASKHFRAYSRKYFGLQGWTYDGTGVIYSKLLNPCLIETSFFFGDDAACYFEVPQPVLKLKVPEEYLLPRETP